MTLEVRWKVGEVENRFRHPPKGKRDRDNSFTPARIFVGMLASVPVSGREREVDCLPESSTQICLPDWLAMSRGLIIDSLIY